MVKHWTHRVDNKQVLLQLLLAVSDLPRGNVLTPRHEGLPLAEQCKRGDLDELHVVHILLLPAVQICEDGLVGLHVGHSFAADGVVVTVVYPIVVDDSVEKCPLV